MIQTIHIKGLKCFDDVNVGFRKLNILAGANSIGKSTILQAILALVQSGKDGGKPFCGVARWELLLFENEDIEEFKSYEGCGYAL